MEFIGFIGCFLIGYLIGTVNPSYIIGKIRGVDIRENGSKNAGASNALIHFGKLHGVVCALLDIGKPCLAIWLAGMIFSEFTYVFAITGVACVLGHVYPFYMGFRGGKGLSCLGGLVLMFDWRVFLIMLTLAIILTLVTDYMFVVSIVASIAFPIIYMIMSKDIIGGLFLFIVSFVMTYKHIENIKRVKNGTEMRLSYLWKKDKEVERIKENTRKDVEK